MTTTKLSLGDRMKSYEFVTRVGVPPRTPVIIRVDGKSFHTVTRKCIKPFDPRVEEAMDLAAKALCVEAQGATLAFIQSDEISVLLHSYKKHDSQGWFDGNIQKMASVSASVASVAFTAAFGAVGLFDSRVFTMPESDVCNYFLWRQQDATRNSINGVGQSLCSARELHGKNTKEVQEMVFQRGQNWNDLPVRHRRGRCAVRDVYDREGVTRSRWVIDEATPIFSADREYVEKHLAEHDEERRSA